MEGLRCCLVAGAALAFLLNPAAAAGEPPAAAAVERSAELQQRLDAALVAKGPDYVARTEHRLADGRPRYTNRLVLEDSPPRRP